MIRTEMNRRGYRTMNHVWDKIVSLKPDWHQLNLGEIYKEKMDAGYLEICYWNLREKWLCGGIKNDDWQKIEERKLMLDTL